MCNQRNHLYKVNFTLEIIYHYSGLNILSITLTEYEDLTPPAYMLVQDGQICAYDARLPDVSASDINPECLEDVNGDVLAHDYQERNVFIGSGGSITKFHWPTMQSSVIFQGDSSISGKAYMGIYQIRYTYN